MNKKIFASITALAAAVSCVSSAFADYTPIEPPTDSGYFEFYEDFSECTAISDGGNSVADSWANIYSMSVGDPIITRDDGVKWIVSSKKSSGGGVNSAAYVDINNDRLYVKGGGANTGMLRLDLSEAQALEGIDISSLPKQVQEIEFKERVTSRSAAVTLFLNSDDTTDKTYVVFGVRNGESVSETPSTMTGSGAYVRFMMDGVALYEEYYGGITDATWKVKVDDGLLSWNVNNGQWSGSHELDPRFLENFNYLAGFMGGGDSGGYLEYFKYRTGNSYTPEFNEPEEAVYLNTFDKANVVDEENRIYELTEPTVARRVEYKNYGGGEFGLSEDGVNWDFFSRDDEGGAALCGVWTAKDTAATGTNRWINTCNEKEYQYVMVPESERIIRGQKTGVFKVFKNISKDYVVRTRKNVPVDLYLSSSIGWSTDFGVDVSDTKYVESDSAYITLGYAHINTKKETYSTDESGKPITVTLNGKLSYTVPITIEGPFSDAMNDPDMMDDYLSAQQAVIDIINDAARQYNAENASEDEKLAAIETVMNFFVYDKTIFDIDAVIAQQLLEDINDLPNDRKTAFAKRLLSSNPTFTFGSLEDITEAEKAMVLEYTVEEVCKVSDTAELEANLKNNNDILMLPLDNKYYKELTDDVLRRMINIDFANSGDLQKQFADNYVMVAFNAAGISKTYLVNVISDCEEEIGYDAEKFNKRSDTEKEALAKALIDGKDSITDIEQLRDAIDGYDKKEEPTPTKKPSSSSSGGGGGGSVKVPYTKPVIENQNKPDTEPVVEKKRIFNDVAEDFWGYEYIRHLNGIGAMDGYDDGSFKPNVSITRAEFIKIIVESFGFEVEEPSNEPADETTDEANGEPTDQTEGEANGEGDIEPPEAVFNDCPFDAWYYKYVKSAKDNNIVTGDDDNRINPQAPITREECAVILNRVITQRGIALARVNELVRFNDSGNISPWASYAVSELQVMGVLNGDNGMIYPKNSTTRAETAKMISEILNKSKEAAVSE